MTDTSDAATENDTTKHIFVTGGVVSSLGKGLTAASLLVIRALGREHPNWTEPA